MWLLLFVPVLYARNVSERERYYNERMNEGREARPDGCIVGADVPNVIVLTGGGVIGYGARNAANCLGRYHLEADRDVNGRLVWRQITARTHFLPLMQLC